VCRRITANDADAADAAQNALIAMAKGLARFDGRSRLSTWVHRIAVNASLDEVRRRSRRATTSLDGVFEEPAVDHVDSRADALDIDAALRDLPETFRAPVVLRDLCGLDYDEIADVLDLAPGTVRSRISRGRAALAKALGPVRNDT